MFRNLQIHHRGQKFLHFLWTSCIHSTPSELNSSRSINLLSSLLLNFPSGLFLWLQLFNLLYSLFFEFQHHKATLFTITAKTFDLRDKFSDIYNAEATEFRTSKGKFYCANFTCEEALTSHFQVVVLSRFPTQSLLWTALWWCSTTRRLVYERQKQSCHLVVTGMTTGKRPSQCGVRNSRCTLYLWIIEVSHQPRAKRTVALTGTFNWPKPGPMKCTAYTAQGPVVYLKRRNIFTGPPFTIKFDSENYKESGHDLATLWCVFIL
jgi:hypothetical protein